jgi:hypothetical protein
MTPFHACGACAALFALLSGVAAAANPRDVPVSATRVSRPVAPAVVKPRASDGSASDPVWSETPANARLPPGGETAPGSIDPIAVPFRQTATFHPAWLGAYGRPGPFAPAVSTKAFNLNLQQQTVYGFTRIVAAFPFEHDDADESDDAYPLVAWGVGAHNPCTHVDNRETLIHLASWGFIAVCPEVLPEPYPGDEIVLFQSLKFALDKNADATSRLHLKIDTSAIGIAGYSLGGGRVVRGLSALARFDRIAAKRESPRENEFVHSRSRGDQLEEGARSRGEEVGEPHTSLTRRSSSPSRALLEVDPNTVPPLTCEDVACVARSVGAAVSLQGWNEGFGAPFSTPVLLLGTDNDIVVGNWRDTIDRVFNAAVGNRLLGVVRGGGHNLGPHYWFAWTVAFLRGELAEDQEARDAVWGTSDGDPAAPDEDPSKVPFAKHPNLKFAKRFVLKNGDVETFEFAEEETCVWLIPELSC